MFQKLILRNFQPHRKLVVKFDEHVTCIIGPTDTGKSSIIRALRWLCLNSIKSKRFISWWAKRCSVTLHVDGHIIKRSKGKENLYFLDKQEFKAFGTTVPEPIAKILNVSEENFQRQIDPPLWLASSPAQVGRELNKIVNLDIIDLTLSNVSKAKREAQAKVKSLISVRNTLKKEAEDLEWIVECKRDVERLEKAERKREELAEDVAVLSHLLQKVLDHKKTRDNAKECLVGGELALAREQEAEQLRDRVGSLGKLIKRITTASQTLADNKRELASVQIKLGRIKECPVCQKPLT